MLKITWFHFKYIVFIRPVWIKNLPNSNLLVVCLKPVFFVLFRISEILFALATRETVLARVFDLHFLPEQYQLGVFSVRVIVFNVTNVLVMINPPVRSYEFIWTIHFFHFISEVLPFNTTNATK